MKKIIHLIHYRHWPKMVRTSRTTSRGGFRYQKISEFCAECRRLERNGR